MTVCKLAASKMSSYGLTARVVLEEKGVFYERVEIDPGNLKSDDHLKNIHPFGKVPALFHGNLHLFETAAIARYVDEAFDGPELQPDTARARAQMQKWINISGQYIYPTMIGGLVMQRLASKIHGGDADEAVVAAAIPQAALQLALIEAALNEQEHLAGDFSLADIFVASIVQYIGLTPEGMTLMKEHSAAADWVAKITSRPSYSAAAYDLGF